MSIRIHHQNAATKSHTNYHFVSQGVYLRAFVPLPCTLVKTLKEYFDQPETTWQQFFRRLDQLEPYCRIEGHTSEEVREILAALEKAYAPALPQLNLLRWGSSIYTWLTNPVLDPTHSGRVTMNYLMKLVKTALEWSYEAKSTDVLIEMLEKAATLLVLRRNTLWIIDGVGPTVEISQSDTTGQESRQEAEAETPAKDSPPTHHNEAGEIQRAIPSTNCSFSGPIKLEVARWMESKVEVVQCPACGSVSKAKRKEQSIVIVPHPPRKSRPVRNITRWAEQRTDDWGLVQKKA